MVVEKPPVSTLEKQDFEDSPDPYFSDDEPRRNLPTLKCGCCGSPKSRVPLLRDCMWPQTGLDLIIKARRGNSFSKESFSDCSNTESAEVGCTYDPFLDSTKQFLCVNPMWILPDRRFSSGGQYSSNTESTENTDQEVVDCDEFTSCSKNSDDEYINVDDDVSMSQRSKCQEDESPLLRQMLVLPATDSMSAQIAAMHNYSSSIHYFDDDSSLTRLAFSAPQSPIEQVETAPFNSKPASPVFQQPRTKSQKLRQHKLHRAASIARNQSSGSEDDTTKRAQHNVLERQRRSNLKDKFYALRDSIPDLYGKMSASKLAILIHAKKHIASMRAWEKRLAAEKARELRLAESLRLQMSHL